MPQGRDPAREEQLAHLAPLRNPDPEYRADTIAPKRIQRVKLFGGGRFEPADYRGPCRADGSGLSNAADRGGNHRSQRLRPGSQTGLHPARAGEPVLFGSGRWSIRSGTGWRQDGGCGRIRRDRRGIARLEINPIL